MIVNRINLMDKVKKIISMIKKMVLIHQKYEDLILTYGLTDVGLKRNNNEDAFWINPTNDLFIVVDGMGGHKAGEIASNMAIELLQGYLNEKSFEETGNEAEKIKNLFIGSLSNTSTLILKAGKENPDYSGMGCTAVCAWLTGNHLYSSHVGDARIYVCHHDTIKQLGFDHSFVAEAVKLGKLTREEARLSTLKNQINQALGMPINIEPEYQTSEINPGDRILLCSDGLWDMLSDEDIHKILFSSDDAKVICEELIRKANEAGGYDNTTVIVKICM
ncbi:MAG: Stp1/IreP family PP2C-type Ser/Thr phosphatase [Lentimicrobium sp.]|nr:Stp1/IreP family PP2C-type Ser/Thr phosphatase [Lentimicrobium sp.]